MTIRDIAAFIDSLPIETDEDAPFVRDSEDRVFARFDGIEVNYDELLKELSIDFYWKKQKVHGFKIPCASPYENTLCLYGFNGKIEGNFL